MEPWTEQEQSIGVAYDSAGREWTGRCTCRWWVRHEDRSVVERALSEHLREESQRWLAPLDQWAGRCHAASVELVRTVGRGFRVARGVCDGVGSQHSWVVVGDDCYADDAIIIDPTLWDYDESVTGVWTGSYRAGRHHPHGKGSIWNWGRPDSPTGEIIELTPRQPWSREAEDFLEILGPLDRRGWAILAHAPVEEWPAAEIIDAMCESGLEAVIPIDIVGMLTDRNPGQLYLP